jgi:hypothetical protein
MISLLSLAGMGAVFAALAMLVAWLRGLPRRTAAADAVASLSATLAALIAASVLYALSHPLDSTALWRHLGSGVLIASPVAAISALRLRSRRSIPRALVASGVAIVGVVVWLTLHLKGVRAGWSLLEIAMTVGAATLAVGSAACLGWWSKRPRGATGASIAVVLLLGVAAACAGEPAAVGTLELTLVDASTGEPTPARVEILSADGRSIVPDDALPIFADCGSVPVHNWLPWVARIQARWNRHRDVANPYTGTDQFYADGSVAAPVPVGRYTVTVSKGIEYRLTRAEVVVVEKQTEGLRLNLKRWIDLPSRGWWSADDHLHIPRPHPGLDPVIATWMQAEDVHVANLLQMGWARDVHITPQRGFGSGSVYRRGDTLVLSGQENPRTHVLGHSIILGARHWIDFPRSYLLYDRFWTAAREQGGIAGLAHWGLGGAEEALAVWGHRDLLRFIEVLGAGFPFYERWYEALDLGIRIGPTAGTDYPCLASLPGRERFYTKLDARLEPDAWLPAVRLGRTFVTNGPVVDLTVDGVEVGGEASLPAPGPVRVRGSVRFDPERDEVRRLELVRAGEVVRSVEHASSPGLFEIDTEVDVERSTWFALRALGEKRGEIEVAARDWLRSMLILKRRTNEEVLEAVRAGSIRRPSAAHTAAIWVVVAGTPPVSRQAKAMQVVDSWLDRLDELRGRFDDDRMAEIVGFPGRGDGIGEAEWKENRAALLEAIERARAYYTRPGE